MKYVVEVKDPLPDDLGQAAGRLADAFNISEHKALALLGRLPGVVTKPVSEQEAHVVAGLFSRAGMNVVTRLEGVPSGPSEAGGPGAAVQGLAAAHANGSANGSAHANGRVADAARQGRAHPDPFSSALVALATPPGSGWSADDFPPVPTALGERPPLLSSVEDTLTTERRSRAGGAALPAGAPPSGVRDPSPAPAAAGARASNTAERRPRRASLRRKILLAGIAPALLTIVVALAAVVVTVVPAFRAQLLEAAHNPAIAFANGVEVLVGERALTDPEVRADLQAMTLLSQAEFRRQNIAFVLITDAQGERLAGWYQDSSSSDDLPDALAPVVRARARDAAAKAYADLNDIERGSFGPPSRRVELGGAAIETAAEPIRGDDRLATGAVVIGIADADVARRIRTVLLGTLAAGLVPILIGVVAAVALTRSLTRTILFLIGAADKISRGDPATEIELASDDELGDLSRAIERMRVSLEEGLTRLRRRRR